jgi:hypothetical protein
VRGCRQNCRLFNAVRDHLRSQFDVLAMWSRSCETPLREGPRLGKCDAKSSIDISWTSPNRDPGVFQFPVKSGKTGDRMNTQRIQSESFQAPDGVTSANRNKVCGQIIAANSLYIAGIESDYSLGNFISQNSDMMRSLKSNFLGK